VYGRLASGYRPGGPNSPDRIVEGAPSGFRPDKTQNYEIGAKGDFLDHTLTFDSSIYYIDWKSIQLQLLTPLGLSYGANGGAAKSEGAEISVTSRPLAGLSVSAWLDYDNAVLKEALPSNGTAVGAAGDRLPLSSRISGNLSVQQDFPLWQGGTGFVGGEVSYVGSRQGQFQGTPTRQDFPAYTKTDLQVGVKGESWKASVYANNVANIRGMLTGGPADLYNPDAFIYIQPRTVGLNFSHSF